MQSPPKPPAASKPRLIVRLWHQFIVYLLKFGVVGAVGFVIDIGIFNLLLLGFAGEGWWSHPVGAKLVSTVVAIFVNWLGNRFWTFRRDRHRHVAREFAEFVTASLIGMGFTLAFVWLTNDVLGYTSVLANNISANVIGLALGTLVRFVLYRFWVWGYRPPGDVAAGTPSAQTTVSTPEKRHTT